LKLNKSFITNALSLELIIFSFVSPLYSDTLLYAGLFAFSGAITNQLAIYMLFEKVPFLYGSGVIPLRFKAFKTSIKNLMMSEFFTLEQLENFFKSEEKKIDLEPIIQKTNFSPAFDALSQTVMESPLGGMLGMFGGVAALDGLKEPFILKMKDSVANIVNSNEFTQTLQEQFQKSSLNLDMLNSIENVIDKRLDILTPTMVKEIVQELIKEHLDWLVVWGGVFGGLIGLVSSLFL